MARLSLHFGRTSHNPVAFWGCVLVCVSKLSVSVLRFRAAKVLQQVGSHECSKLPTPPFTGITREELANHCTNKGSKCSLCDDGLIDERSINKEMLNLCVMHKSHCVAPVPPRISFTMPNPWSEKTRKREQAMITAKKKMVFFVSVC